MQQVLYIIMKLQTDHGYPKGLTKKDIPYEGQIIRVADEYDAIVSKRQYKSHIGISDTLKILIENTKPHENIQKSAVLNEIATNTKLGKDNPIIVRALFKVVIDDIEYEISCVLDYLEDLKKELKRFKEIDKYKEKMENSKTEKKKNYYLEGMKCLLLENETIESYTDIKAQYEKAYDTRKKIIDNLFNEIKIIKKLKV